MLNRRGEAPHRAMASLLAEFGERGAIVEGSLPESLIELAQALRVEVPEVIARPAEIFN